MKITQNANKHVKKNRDDLIFYCVFLAWPVLQFVLFYIGVNINSILMSFQKITVDPVTKEYITDFFTLEQYKNAIKWFGTEEVKTLAWFSIKAFFITTLIGTPLGLLFSFYVFKKLPFWSLFRVLLYLPGVLSSVVVAAMYRFFLTDCLPFMLPSVGNLLDPLRELEFPILMFYNLWSGFGGGVLMYSNKMSTIPEEIIESANLDGATGIKEFWYIVLPMAYGTLSLFIVTGVAGIFLAQYAAYDMYGGYASTRIQGIGYWFYVSMLNRFSEVSRSAELPYYAALGVCLTFITLPLMFITKWVTEKFGPSED